MRHPAVEPTVGMAAHAVAALGEDRLALRQAFTLEVLQEVRLTGGVDAALLYRRQSGRTHSATSSAVVSTGATFL